MSSVEKKTNIAAQDRASYMRAPFILPEKAHDIDIGEDARVAGVDAGGLLLPARDGAVSRGEWKIHWPVEEGAGA